jgi:hypothetical protein
VVTWGVRDIGTGVTVVALFRAMLQDRGDEMMYAGRTAAGLDERHWCEACACPDSTLDCDTRKVGDVVHQPRLYGCFRGIG